MRAMMFAGGGLFLSMVATTMWISGDVNRMRQEEQARRDAACAVAAPVAGPGDAAQPAGYDAAGGQAPSSSSGPGADCPDAAGTTGASDPATGQQFDPATGQPIAGTASDGYADPATDPYGGTYDDPSASSAAPAGDPYAADAHAADPYASGGASTDPALTAPGSAQASGGVPTPVDAGF